MATETKTKVDTIAEGLDKAGFKQTDKTRESIGELIKSPIQSSQLKPTSKMNITDPKPATEGVGLEGTLSALSESNKTQIEAEKAQKEADTKQQKDLQSINEFVLGQETEGEIRSDINEKEGVNELDKERTELFNQIDAEARSLELKLRRLDENPEGLFGGALQAEKDRVRKDSLEKQADLSIILNAKNNQFETARSIADQKVKAITERQRLELDALQFTYEENKELFTRDEQRAFERSQSSEKRKLDQVDDFNNFKNDLAMDALENGATQAQAKAIFNAKDEQGAILARSNAPFKAAKASSADKASQAKEEFELAEKFVAENTDLSDEELKSTLLRDSDLTVSEINAIIDARTGLRPNQVVQLSRSLLEEDFATLIEENFDKPFFSRLKKGNQMEEALVTAKNKALVIAKEKAFEEVDLATDLTDSEKQQLKDKIKTTTLDELANITLDDITI